jgi:hypothetical protein
MFDQGCLGPAGSQNRAANNHELENADVFGPKLYLKLKTPFFLKISDFKYYDTISALPGFLCVQTGERTDGRQVGVPPG